MPIIGELSKFITRPICFPNNEYWYNTKEITVDRSTFALTLQCSKTTKEAVIHEILLHFVQSFDKQPLEDVMKHLEKAIGNRTYVKNNQISNPNEEFRTHTNIRYWENKWDAL